MYYALQYSKLSILHEYMYGVPAIKLLLAAQEVIRKQ